MKAVTVAQDATGKEVSRIEKEYASPDTAKADAVALLTGNKSVTKVVVHEDSRELDDEGKPKQPNVHDPKFFTPRIVYQKHHETGDPELIGESWP